MTQRKTSRSAPESQPSKRYVNRSALAISLVVLAVLSGGGYAWYRFSLYRNTEALRDYAEQCADAHDYAAAATQFDRYVQFRPDDASARIRLAETYDLAFSNAGRAQRAIELYREALGVAPEQQKASIRIRLGELLFRTQQYVAAADEAQAILQRDPENSPSANLLALALYGQIHQGSYKGKPEDVGTSFEKALSHDPGERSTAVSLARIYREEPHLLGGAGQTMHVAQREKAADQIIDRLVAAHPQQPEARLVRYEYRRRYHVPGAEDDLQEARRLGPENPDVLLASAAAYRAEAAALGPSPASADKVRSLREAALAGYGKMIAVSAADFRGYVGLGETELELSHAQAAIDNWQSGLANAPLATATFQLLLAKELVSLGRSDDAEKYLDQLAQKFAAHNADQDSLQKSPLVRRYELIRAAWLRGKSQPIQAIELARRVATGPTATPEEVALAVEAWSAVAETNTLIGRWSEAADAWEKVAELAPKSPQFRALAAAAWMEANQPDRAVRDLRLALGYGDRSELRLALAAATFRQNVTATKDHCNWQEVETALDEARLAQAKQPLPEPWRLTMLEAEIARARAEAEGRHADGVRDAAAIYRRVKLDENAKQTALPALAMAFDRLELHDEADRVAAEWEKTAPPQRPQMLRAQLAANRKKYDDARHLLEAGIEQSAPAERAQAQRFLLQLSLASRDWQQARRDLDGLTVGPGDMELLYAYAELAEQKHQPAEVDRCLQKSIELEGNDNRCAQAFRARRILEQAATSDSVQLRTAQEIIDRLIMQNPDWPPGLLLRCRLLELDGRSDEAISAYIDAIRRGATGLGTYERLVDLLTRAGRNAEARSYLDALREQSLTSDSADVVAAQLSARRGDREQALSIIRREAQREPTNAAIQISFGQMLMATNRTAEAVAVFQRVVDIAPDSLQAVLGLAICFVETNKLDQARGLLTKLADRNDLPYAQKQLVVAQIADILGDKQAARDHYQAACDVAHRDPDVRIRMVEFLLRTQDKADAAAAEKLLRTIIADSPTYAPARGTLARILAQRGGETSWKEARALLQSSSDGKIQSDSSRRMEAMLLINHGGAANREQARQILNDLVRHADADVIDRALLARLEDQEGRTDQARAQYVAISSSQNPPVDALAAYADFLVRHGPAEDADLMIGRIERLAADDLGCLALRVRWLHARRRDGEIGPLVEAAAARLQKASTASSEESARLCVSIGELYEMGEQYPAAEGWYRRLLNTQPDNFEPLAGVLARQKRGGEAIQVCLDASKHATPARAAMAACTMRATCQIEDKDLRAAESLIDATEKDNPAPRFLAMLAAVRVLQDRADEAIALYQRALAADPHNVRIMNNLATLFGERPGHVKESLEFIDRAINSVGPQGWLLETKGQILLRDGRVDEAIALLEESATSAEPDPRVLLHLAQAYRIAGKPDQARTAFDGAQKRFLMRQVLTPDDRKLIKELNAEALKAN